MGDSLCGGPKGWQDLWDPPGPGERWSGRGHSTEEPEKARRQLSPRASGGASPAAPPDRETPGLRKSGRVNVIV